MMDSKTKILIENRGKGLWIKLPDSITINNRKEVEEAIGKHLTDTRQNVIIDFSNMNIIYSSGLGLMIRIRRFVIERGGVLSLVNVSKQLYEIFETLNINKIFTIYTTDVEFEISQAGFMDVAKKESIGFLFISTIEHGCYRIHISGDMTSSFDLAPCRKFDPSPVISLYLIDMAGLEIIDDSGIEELVNLTKRIATAGGICRLYGLSEVNHEMMSALGAEKYVTFYADEQTAVTG